MHSKPTSSKDDIKNENRFLNYFDEFLKMYHGYDFSCEVSNVISSRTDNFTTTTVTVYGADKIFSVCKHPNLRLSSDSQFIVFDYTYSAKFHFDGEVGGIIFSFDKGDDAHFHISPFVVSEQFVKDFLQKLSTIENFKHITL